MRILTVHIYPSIVAMCIQLKFYHRVHCRMWPVFFCLLFEADVFLVPAPAIIWIRCIDDTIAHWVYLKQKCFHKSFDPVHRLWSHNFVGERTKKRRQIFNFIYVRILLTNFLNKYIHCETNKVYDLTVKRKIHQKISKINGEDSIWYSNHLHKKQETYFDHSEVLRRVETLQVPELFNQWFNVQNETIEVNCRKRKVRYKYKSQINTNIMITILRICNLNTISKYCRA